MRKYAFSGLFAGLLLVILQAFISVQAHETGMPHGLASVHSIFVNVKGPDPNAINRNNTSDLCLVALNNALQEEGFSIADRRAHADAELRFTGSYITVTEGRSGKVGNALLSYAVVLQDRKGTALWSMVDDHWGDSIADACREAAEEIADELEEAHDDAD